MLLSDALNAILTPCCRTPDPQKGHQNPHIVLYNSALGLLRTPQDMDERVAFQAAAVGEIFRAVEALMADCPPDKHLRRSQFETLGNAIIEAASNVPAELLYSLDPNKPDDPLAAILERLLELQKDHALPDPTLKDQLYSLLKRAKAQIGNLRHRTADGQS